MHGDVQHIPTTADPQAPKTIPASTRSSPMREDLYAPNTQFAKLNTTMPEREKSQFDNSCSNDYEKESTDIHLDPPPH